MAANPYLSALGLSDSQPSQSKNPYLDIINNAKPVAPTPEPNGLTRRIVQDLPVGLAKSAVSLGETAVGLADIPTLGLAGKGLEKIGYRPKETQAYLESLYSPETQQAAQNVAKEQGFLPTLGAVVGNPSVIPKTIVESSFPMAGGLGVAGKLQRAYGLSSPLASGIGESAITAGQNAEQVRQESTNGLLSPKQAAISAGSGALTGLITAGTGRVANSLGIGDINQLGLTRDVAGANKGLTRRIAESGGLEGFQEGLQSAQEQASQNLALDKPIGQDVGNSAALGAITGLAMGAPTGLVTPVTGEKIPDLKADSGALTRALHTNAIEVNDGRDITGNDQAATGTNQFPDGQDNGATGGIGADERNDSGQLRGNDAGRVDGNGRGLASATDQQLNPVYDRNSLNAKEDITQPFAQETAGQRLQNDKQQTVQDSLDGFKTYLDTLDNGGTESLFDQEQGVNSEAKRRYPKRNEEVGFNPTHEDVNGNLYQATIDPFIFVDQDGSEWEDDKGQITPISLDGLRPNPVKPGQINKNTEQDAYAKAEREAIQSEDNTPDDYVDNIPGFDALIEQPTAQAGLGDVPEADFGKKTAFTPTHTDSAGNLYQATDNPDEFIGQDGSLWADNGDITPIQPAQKSPKNLPAQKQAESVPVQQPAQKTPDSVPSLGRIATDNKGIKRIFVEKNENDLVDPGKTKEAPKNIQGLIDKAKADGAKEIWFDKFLTPIKTLDLLKSHPELSQVSQGAFKIVSPENNKKVVKTKTTQGMPTSVTVSKFKNPESAIDEWKANHDIAPEPAQKTPESIQVKDDVYKKGGNVNTTPVKGVVGGKIAPGEKQITASGRETTPFPKDNRTTRNADAWLIRNAMFEAYSRGDDFNHRQFKADLEQVIKSKAKNGQYIPQASKDAAEEYLFGQQPDVPKPFLKPLVSPTTVDNNNALSQETPGEKAYNEDLKNTPNYDDGTPRKSWDQLSNIEKSTWEKNPTPRKVKPDVQNVSGKVSGKSTGEVVEAKPEAKQAKPEKTSETAKNKQKWGIPSKNNVTEEYPGYTTLKDGRTVGNRTVDYSALKRSKLERLLSKQKLTKNDIEDLKDFKWLLIFDEQGAFENGLLNKLHVSQKGDAYSLKNLHWLVNIDNKIRDNGGNPQDMVNHPSVLLENANKIANPSEDAPKVDKQAGTGDADKEESVPDDGRSLSTSNNEVADEVSSAPSNVAASVEKPFKTYNELKVIQRNHFARSKRMSDFLQYVIRHFDPHDLAFGRPDSGKISDIGIVYGELTRVSDGTGASQKSKRFVNELGLDHSDIVVGRKLDQANVATYRVIHKLSGIALSAVGATRKDAINHFVEQIENKGVDKVKNLIETHVIPNQDWRNDVIQWYGGNKETTKKPSREENAEPAQPSAEADSNLNRYDIGKSLTKEQRNQVLKTLVDVYKAKGADKEVRINSNGDEYTAYPYQPDLFEKSDITGQMVRYFVTLPDGKKAHPTELFPDMTQAKVDALLLEIKENEDREQKTRDKLLSSGKDTVDEANQLFRKGHYSELNPDRYGDHVDASVLFEKNGKYIRVREEKYADILLDEGWNVRNANEKAAEKYKKLGAKTEPEQASAETDSAETSGKPEEAKPYTLASHADIMQRLEQGDLSAEDYKAEFERLVANEEAITAELNGKTKDTLLKEFPQLYVRYRNEKKDYIVDAAYRELVKAYHIQPGGISYGFGTSIETAIKNGVEKTTDADLKQYAEDYQKAEAERQAAKEQRQAGMENPQTLEDYTRLLRSWLPDVPTFKDAYMKLTPEQRETYDLLYGEQTRSERKARADQQKTDVKVAATTTSGDIIETKHTKTGEDLFVVKAAERVERDTYNEWNTTAKRLGGWYSSYRVGGAVPGFQFKTRENAEAFLKYLGGDVTEAKDAVQARRDAYADDKSQSAVERLTEMADRLEEKADEELGRSRKENTAKRAREAASAIASAERDKALAKTMRNLAGAIESGKAKFLDNVRQKVQVEYLRGLVNTTNRDMIRQRYKDNYGDYLKHEHDPATKEVAEHVEMPNYTLYRSDLADLGRKLLQTEGTKKYGQALLKEADDVTDAYVKFAKDNLHKVMTFRFKDGTRAGFKLKSAAERAIEQSNFNGKAIVLNVAKGEYAIILSPSEAMKTGIWDGDKDKRITISHVFGKDLVEKLGKVNRKTEKVKIPWQFENAYENRKRLVGMGIETPAELRAAIREFVGLQEVPKAPDKVKEMERAMIGRANDGLDFFPTPAHVADQMVESADIQESMKVLEPSAGWGHIAERIREAGVDPDVIELSPSRRELLEAKGFNVVGSDFTQFEDGGYDRVIMNPPFSDRRDAEHVLHAYNLLKPGGRLVAIMGEGVFFGQDSKAKQFRDWLDRVGGTDEKLEEGTFKDPSLPVNTGVNARMIVVDKSEDAKYSIADEKTGSTISNIKQWLTPTQKKLVDRGRIKLVQSVEDLPLYLQKKGEALYHTAWHGSPHDYDKFDSSKIGTGEGAQAFGYGLYFTDSKDIAGFYREELANSHFTFKGREYFIGQPETKVILSLSKTSSDPSIVREKYKTVLETKLKNEIKKIHKNRLSYSSASRIKEELKELNKLSDLDIKEIQGFKPGKLYQVELAPKPDEYLDWDKPLSDQSKKVRGALDNSGISYPDKNLNTGQKIYEQSAPKGQYLSKSEREKAASDYLYSLGIRGIRYKANGGNSDAYNYVIFSDKDVSITAKYSNDLSGVRGLYDPKSNSIYLIASTLDKNNIQPIISHEAFHWSLENSPILQKRHAEIMQTFQKAFDDAAKGKGAPEMMKAYKRVMAAKTPVHLQAEEFGAYLIEAHAKPGVNLPERIAKAVKNLIAMIKASLLRFGVPIKNLSVADLAAISRSSLEDLSRTEMPDNSRATVFSMETPEYLRQYDEIEAKYFNKDGTEKPGAMLAPNGKRTNLNKTQWVQTRTQAFKDWFGDFENDPENASKVIDENGDPLILSHGTNGDITNFDRNLLGMNTIANASDPAYGATSLVGFWANTGKMANHSVYDIDMPVFMRIKYAYELYDVEDLAEELRNVIPIEYDDSQELQEAVDEWLAGKKEEGYDGVFIKKDKEFGGSSYIAFDPNQIKSAIGNTAAFSPESNDIRYSIADPETIDKVKNYINDFRETSKTFNALDKTLHTQSYKAWKDKDYKKVFDKSVAYEQDVAKFANEQADYAPTLLPSLDGLKDAALEIKRGWKRNKDAKAIGKSIFTATVEEKHFTDEELKAKGHTPEQIAMYHEFYATVNKSLDDLAKSEMAREARAQKMPIAPENMGLKQSAEFYAKAAKNDADAAKFRDKAETIQSLKDKAYAPLMRFGRYTVTVQEEGNDKPTYFGMYETESEAKKDRRILEQEYPDAKIKSGVMSQTSWKMFQGLTPETMEVFAKVAGIEQEQAFQDYLKLAVSNKSAMKRLIHRKNIEGYSFDTQRVLATFITSNARLTSKNLHLGEMLDAISDIPKEKGDVLDEAISLYEFVQNPTSPGLASRNALFAWYLGGSVASAAVNLTQSFTTTYPALHQLGSASDVAKELTKAMRLATRANSLTGELKKALDLADKEGVTKPQDLFQLYGDSARTATMMTANVLRPFSKFWGSFFALAESYNRRVAFIAAYNLSKGSPGEKFKQAEKLVLDTQFLYSKSSRPNWARSAIGSTAFTFKTFSLNYLEFLRKLPRREQAIALGVLLLAAGANGLPGADDADDLIDTIGQMLGYNTSAKGWKEKHINSFLLNGISEFMPFDISKRVGMGNIIPGSALFKRSETDKSRDILEFIGPAGSFYKSMLEAADAVSARGTLGGKLEAASHAAMPLAISNAVKAFDMAETGYYRDYTGKNVTEVSTRDALFKAIGFQPTSVSSVRDPERQFKQLRDYTVKVEGEIAGLWAEGIFEKDRAKIDEAKTTLKDWNERNPETPIKINFNQITRRVKAMRQTSAERLRKSSPQELRALAGQMARDN